MAVIKTVNGLVLASMKTRNGLAAASVKTINGLDAVVGGGGYAFTETFDNATNYDNAGWTAVGSPAPNYTTAPAPLEGTQSLNMPSGSNIYRTVSGSAICLYFQANITTWVNYNDFIEATGAGSAACFQLFLWDSSKIILKHGSQGSGYGATTLSTGTTYHIWVEWAKGTGSNGTMDVYLSTTSTKPGTKELALTTGNCTVDVDTVRLKAGGGCAIIFDRFIHNPTAISSAP